MTRETEHGLLIEPEPPQKCELCGKIEETRPYGPNGARVCFECGMKDEEGARIRFQQRLDEAGGPCD